MPRLVRSVETKTLQMSNWKRFPELLKLAPWPCHVETGNEIRKLFLRILGYRLWLWWRGQNWQERYDVRGLVLPTLMSWCDIQTGIYFGVLYRPQLLCVQHVTKSRITIVGVPWVICAASASLTLINSSLQFIIDQEKTEARLGTSPSPTALYASYSRSFPNLPTPCPKS